jgi:hypothetical protein
VAAASISVVKEVRRRRRKKRERLGVFPAGSPQAIAIVRGFVRQLERARAARPLP